MSGDPIGDAMHTLRRGSWSDRLGLLIGAAILGWLLYAVIAGPPRGARAVEPDMYPGTRVYR